MWLQGRRQRGARGALAPPVFGQTVNPISTRGADYTYHSTTSPPPPPPGISNLATSLGSDIVVARSWRIISNIEA